MPPIRKTRILCVAAFAASAFAQTAVRFDIDLARDARPISPLIYGVNGAAQSQADGVTFSRSGGNRLTGYNWENNASNAGSDWGPHSSDSHMGGGIAPGKSITDFHDANLARGWKSLITLQAAGFVARDKSGNVSQAETAPSARWRPVVFEKGSAFAASPDTADNAVYMDEFVHFLTQRYGQSSGARGVRAYSMDNEPALWPETHPRIHTNKTGAAELADRNAALAKAVKQVDPTAEIFGGVFYGYNAYQSLQDAPDWGAVRGSHAWYIDYFLDRLRLASNAASRRLLDVLDIHWYPEARGDCRIIFETSCNQTGANQVNARLQAPRSLWDSTYVETSWIAQGALGNRAVHLLPRLFASIQRNNPGTRLAITEFDYGAPGHVSGGLALADFLGVIGRQGVYAAHYWPLSTGPFTGMAYRLFRNYDGSGGAFGGWSAHAMASDRALASVFAGFDPGSNIVHVIALNKSQSATLRGTFAVAAPASITQGRVFGFEAGATAVTEKAAVSSVAQNSFPYDLPPLSARHFVLQTSAPLGVRFIAPRLRPRSGGTGLGLDGAGVLLWHAGEMARADGRRVPERQPPHRLNDR